MENYKKRGIGGVSGAIVGLVVGMGVALLVLIFVGVLSGRAYQLNQANIETIANGTIKTEVFNGVTNSFAAYKTVGQYMPLIVLAVVISLVLALILSFTNVGDGQGGTAL